LVLEARLESVSLCLVLLFQLLVLLAEFLLLQQARDRHGQTN
jgi:hypothetical protein